jgi:hypothetical protein
MSMKRHLILILTNRKQNLKLRQTEIKSNLAGSELHYFIILQ